MSELTPEENATFEELAERVTNMKVEHLSGEEGIEYFISIVDLMSSEQRAELLEFFESFVKEAGGHDD